MTRYTIYDKKTIEIGADFDIAIDPATLVFETRVDQYIDLMRCNCELDGKIIRAAIRPYRPTDRLAAMGRTPGLPVLEVRTLSDTMLIARTVRDLKDDSIIWALKAWDSKGVTIETTGNRDTVRQLFNRITAEGSRNVATCQNS